MEYLICKICGYEGKQLHQHIKSVHGMTSSEYRAMFGKDELMQVGFRPNFKDVNPSNSLYVKKGYTKIKDHLNSCEILNLEDVKEFIISNNIKYSGRGKVRTLIKEYPAMYKSIIHYSQNSFIDLNFPDRMRLIIEHDGDINKILCNCGRSYTFTGKCRYCAPAIVKSWLGRHHTDETKLKQRISTLNYIRDSKGQISPRYNKQSISIIEQKASELGIVDLMHAENGGEFSVLGYFIDGYSPSKNVAIEFDERHHYDSNGNLCMRDLNREQEIQLYLGCQFIRIKENKNGIEKKYKI